MNPNSEHDLSTRLTAHADRFDRLGGSELDLDQVLERAGRIKRGRRIQATLLMAACVLAVAVPIGVASLDRGHDRDLQPAPPSKVDRSALTLDGLDAGAPPRTGWVKDRTWHGPDGREYQWSTGRVTGVAMIGDALLVANSDDQGQQQASLVPPVGDTATTVTSWPMEGGFALSADGQLAAFVQPDGTPVVVSASGAGGDHQVDKLPRVQRGSGFSAVGVNGQGCRVDVEFPCQVWVTSHGSSPESWVSTFHGAARRALTILRTVTDVDDASTFAAGVSQVREDLTTCSAVVETVGATPQWDTCDHRLLTFSPDAHRVLATGSVGDGIGDTELAVLDAAKGTVELDLKTTEQTFIGQMVWEDDTHVLATVFESGRWAVLRIGLDGSREYAVAPVTAEDIDSPFVLATR